MILGDIELSPTIQLKQRERTDSTNSVTHGITFEDAGGDESIAPDDCDLVKMKRYLRTRN